MERFSRLAGDFVFNPLSPSGVTRPEELCCARLGLLPGFFPPTKENLPWSVPFPSSSLLMEEGFVLDC